MKSLQSGNMKENLLFRKDLKSQVSENKAKSNFLKKKDLMKKVIIISSKDVDYQTKFYDWRIKTIFPIVKVEKYNLKQCDKHHFILQVQSETYAMNLQQMKEIPLFKILYLLKQSIIGYERLHNKIGSFFITSKMVFFNNKNQCKVWINENYLINKFNKSNQSQMEFIKSVSHIFEQKIKKNRASVSFFNELNKVNTFCGVLQFIQKYASDNKICIPNVYCINKKDDKKEEVNIKIYQSAKNIALPKVNQNNLFDNKKQNLTFHFGPNLTFNRMPNFIKNANLKASNKIIVQQKQENKGSIKRVHSLSIQAFFKSFDIKDNNPQKNKQLKRNIQSNQIDQSLVFLVQEEKASCIQQKKYLTIDRITKLKEIKDIDQFNSQEINLQSVELKNKSKKYFQEELIAEQSNIFYDSNLQQEFINIYKNIQKKQKIQQVMEKLYKNQKNKLNDYGKIASSIHENEHNFRLI